MAPSNDPSACMSARVITRRANFLMVSTGPSSASGGMTTCTRWPCGRRAFTMGDDSSMRRPSGPSTRSTSARSWPSSAKRCSLRNSRPSRSKNTLCGPFTMISVTASSASSPSSGPKPNTASKSSPSSRARCSTATPAQARPSNTRRQALRTSLRARPGFSACRAATSSADTIACTCSFSASRPKAASVPSRRHAPLPARSTLSSRDMAHPSFPRGACRGRTGAPCVLRSARPGRACAPRSRAAGQRARAPSSCTGRSSPR